MVLADKFQQRPRIQMLIFKLVKMLQLLNQILQIFRQVRVFPLLFQSEFKVIVLVLFIATIADKVVFFVYVVDSFQVFV